MADSYYLVQTVACGLVVFGPMPAPPARCLDPHDKTTLVSTHHTYGAAWEALRREEKKK